MAIEPFLTQEQPLSRVADVDVESTPLVTDEGRFDYDAPQFVIEKGALPDFKARREYDRDLYDQLDADPDSLFKYFADKRSAQKFVDAVIEKESEIRPPVEVPSLLGVIGEKAVDDDLFAVAKVVARDIPERAWSKMLHSPTLRRLQAVVEASDVDEDAAAAVLGSDEVVNWLLGHADNLDNNVYEWWRSIRGNNEISAAMLGTKMYVLGATSAEVIRRAASKWWWVKKHFPSVSASAAGRHIDDAAKQAARIGAKGSRILRFVPVIDFLAGVAFTFNRIKDGDYVGAGLELASTAMSFLKAAAWLVAGGGTIAAGAATGGVGALAAAPLLTAIASKITGWDIALDTFILARDAWRAQSDKVGSGRGLAQDVIKAYGRYGVVRPILRGARPSKATAMAAAFAWGWDAISNVFFDDDPYKPRPLGYDQNIESILDTLGEDAGARHIYSRALLALADRALKLKTLDESSPSYRQERAAILSEMRVIVSKLREVDGRLGGRAYAMLDDESTAKFLRRSGYAPDELAKFIARKETSAGDARSIVDAIVSTGNDDDDVEVLNSAIRNAASELLQTYFGGNTEMFYGTLNKRPQEVKAMIVDLARKRLGKEAETIGSLERIDSDYIASVVLREPFTDKMSERRQLVLHRVKGYIESRAHELTVNAATKMIEQDWKEKFVNGELSEYDLQAYAKANYQKVYDRLYPVMRDWVLKKFAQLVQSTNAVGPDDAKESYVKFDTSAPSLSKYSLGLLDANVVSSTNEELYNRTIETIVDDLVGVERTKDINPAYDRDLRGTPFEKAYIKDDMFGNLSHLSDDALGVLRKNLEIAAKARIEKYNESLRSGADKYTLMRDKFNALRTLLTINWLNDLVYLRARATGNMDVPETDLYGVEHFPKWLDATLDNWRKDYWIGKIFAISRGATAHLAGDIAADEAFELKRLRVMREWFEDRGDTAAADYITERLDFYEKAIKYMHVATGLAMYQYDSLPVAMQMFIEMPFDVGQNIMSAVSGAVVGRQLELAREALIKRVPVEKLYKEPFYKWLDDVLNKSAARFNSAETVLGPYFVSVLDAAFTSPSTIARTFLESHYGRLVEKIANAVDVHQKALKDVQSVTSEAISDAQKTIDEAVNLLEQMKETPDVGKRFTWLVLGPVAWVLGKFEATASFAKTIREYMERAHWFEQGEAATGIKRAVSLILSRNVDDAVTNWSGNLRGLQEMLRAAQQVHMAPDEVKSIIRNVRTALLSSPNVPASEGFAVAFAKKLIRGLTRKEEVSRMEHIRNAVLDMIESVSDSSPEVKKRVLEEAKQVAETVVNLHKFASDALNELLYKTSGAKQLAETFSPEAEKKLAVSKQRLILEITAALLADSRVFWNEDQLTRLMVGIVQRINDEALPAGIDKQGVLNVINSYLELKRKVASDLVSGNPLEVRNAIVGITDNVEGEFSYAKKTLIGNMDIIRNLIERLIRSSNIDEEAREFLMSLVPSADRMHEVVQEVAKQVIGTRLPKDEIEHVLAALSVPFMIEFVDGSHTAGIAAFQESLLRYIAHAFVGVEDVSSQLVDVIYGRARAIERGLRQTLYEQLEKRMVEAVFGFHVNRARLMSRLSDSGVIDRAVQYHKQIGNLSDEDAAKFKEVLVKRLQEYIDRVGATKVTAYTTEEILNEVIKPLGDDVRIHFVESAMEAATPVQRSVTVIEDGKEVVYNLDTMKADDLDALVAKVATGEAQAKTADVELIQQWANLRQYEMYKAQRGMRNIERPSPRRYKFVSVVRETGKEGQVLTEAADVGGMFFDTLEEYAEAQNKVVNVIVRDASDGIDTLSREGYVAIPLVGKQSVVYVPEEHFDNVSKRLFGVTKDGAPKLTADDLRSAHAFSNIKAISAFFSPTASLELTAAPRTAYAMAEDALGISRDRAIAIGKAVLSRKMYTHRENIRKAKKAYKDAVTAYLLAKEATKKERAGIAVPAMSRAEAAMKEKKKALKEAYEAARNTYNEYVYGVGGEAPKLAQIVFAETFKRFKEYFPEVGVKMPTVDIKHGAFKGMPMHAVAEQVVINYKNMLVDYIMEAAKKFNGVDFEKLDTREMRAAITALKRKIADNGEPDFVHEGVYKFANYVLGKMVTYNEVIEASEQANVLSRSEDVPAWLRDLYRRKVASMRKKIGVGAARKSIYEVDSFGDPRGMKVLYVNSEEAKKEIFAEIAAALRKKAESLSGDERKEVELAAKYYEAGGIPLADGIEFANPLSYYQRMAENGIPLTSESKNALQSKYLTTKGLTTILSASERAALDVAIAKIASKHKINIRRSFLTGGIDKIVFTENLRKITKVGADGKPVKEYLGSLDPKEPLKLLGVGDTVIPWSSERVYVDVMKDAFRKRNIVNAPAQFLSRGLLRHVIQDFFDKKGVPIPASVVNRWLTETASAPADEFADRMLVLAAGMLDFSDLYAGPQTALTRHRIADKAQRIKEMIHDANLVRDGVRKSPGFENSSTSTIVQRARSFVLGRTGKANLGEVDEDEARKIILEFFSNVPAFNRFVRTHAGNDPIQAIELLGQFSRLIDVAVNENGRWVVDVRGAAFARELQRGVFTAIEHARQAPGVSLFYRPYMPGMKVYDASGKLVDAPPLSFNEVYLPVAYKDSLMVGNADVPAGRLAVGSKVLIVDNPAYWRDNSFVATVAGFYDGDAIVISPHRVYQNQGDFDGDTASVLFKSLSDDLVKKLGMSYRGTPRALDLSVVLDIAERVNNENAGDLSYDEMVARFGKTPDRPDGIDFESLLYYQDKEVRDRFAAKINKIRHRVGELRGVLKSMSTREFTDEEIIRMINKQVEYGTIDNKVSTVAMLINLFDQLMGIEEFHTAMTTPLSEILPPELYKSLKANGIIEDISTKPVTRAFAEISRQSDGNEFLFDRTVRVLQEQMLIGLDREVAKIPFWSFIDTYDSDRLWTFLGEEVYAYSKDRLDQLDRIIADYLIRLKYAEELLNKRAGKHGDRFVNLFAGLLYDAYYYSDGKFTTATSFDEWVRNALTRRDSQGRLAPAIGSLLRQRYKQVRDSGDLRQLERLIEGLRELNEVIARIPGADAALGGKKVMLDYTHEMFNVDLPLAIKKYYKVQGDAGMNMSIPFMQHTITRLRHERSVYEGRDDLPGTKLYRYEEVPFKVAMGEDVQNAARPYHTAMRELGFESGTPFDFLDETSAGRVRFFSTFRDGKTYVVVDGCCPFGLADESSYVPMQKFVDSRRRVFGRVLEIANDVNASDAEVNAAGIVVGMFVSYHSGLDDYFKHVVERIRRAKKSTQEQIEAVRDFLASLVPIDSMVPQVRDICDRVARRAVNLETSGSVKFYNEFVMAIKDQLLHMLEDTHKSKAAILLTGFMQGASGSRPATYARLYVMPEYIPNFDATIRNRLDEIGDTVSFGKLEEEIYKRGGRRVRDQDVGDMISQMSPQTVSGFHVIMKDRFPEEYARLLREETSAIESAVIEPDVKKDAKHYLARRAALREIAANLKEEDTLDRYIKATQIGRDYAIPYPDEYGRKGMVYTNDRSAVLSNPDRYRLFEVPDSVRNTTSDPVLVARDIAQQLNDEMEDQVSDEVAGRVRRMIESAFKTQPAPARTEASIALQNAVRIYKQYMLGFLGGGLRFATFNAIENVIKFFLYYAEETAEGNDVRFSDAFKFIGLHGGGNADDIWRAVAAFAQDGSPDITRANGAAIRRLISGGRGMNIFDRYSRRGVMATAVESTGSWLSRMMNNYQNMMSKYMRWVGEHVETPFRNAVFANKFRQQLLAMRLFGGDPMTMITKAAIAANKTVDELYFDYANKLGFLSGVGQIMFPFGDFRVLNMQYWIKRFAANPMLVRFAMRMQPLMISKKGGDPRRSKFKVPYTDLYVNPFTLLSFNDVLRHIVENPYFTKEQERKLEAIYQKIKDWPEEAQRAFAFRTADGPEIMEYVQWRQLKPFGELAKMLDSYLGVNVIVKGLANYVAGAVTDAKVFEKQPFRGFWGSWLDLANALWPKGSSTEPTLLMRIMSPHHSDYIRQQAERTKNLLVKSMNMSPEEAGRVANLYEGIKHFLGFLTGLFPQYIPKQLADYTFRIAKITGTQRRIVNDFPALSQYIIESHVPDIAAYSLFSRTAAKLNNDVTSGLIVVPVRSGDTIQFVFLDAPDTDAERCVLTHLLVGQNQLYFEDLKNVLGSAFEEWQYSAYALAALKAIKPELRREFALRRGINPTPVQEALDRYFARNRYEYLKAVREFLRAETKGNVFSVLREDLVDDMQEVDRFERMLRKHGHVTQSLVKYAEKHFSSWVADYAAKRYVWDNFTKIEWRNPDSAARRGVEALGGGEKELEMLALYRFAREHFGELHDLVTFSNTKDLSGLAWSPAKVSSMSPALRRDLQRFFPDMRVKISQGARYYKQVVVESGYAPEKDEREIKVPKQIEDLAASPSRRMIKNLSQKSVDWLIQHGMSDALEKTLRTGNPVYVRDAVRKWLAYVR